VLCPSLVQPYHILHLVDVGFLLILFLKPYFINFYFLITRGVSLKKTEKNKISKVPINKKVYTNASMFNPFFD
jgi:hypothetical protein